MKQPTFEEEAERERRSKLYQLVNEWTKTFTFLGEQEPTKYTTIHEWEKDGYIIRSVTGSNVWRYEIEKDGYIIDRLDKNVGSTSSIELGNFIRRAMGLDEFTLADIGEEDETSDTI